MQGNKGCFKLMKYHNIYKKYYGNYTTGVTIDNIYSLTTMDMT